MFSIDFPSLFVTAGPSLTSVQESMALSTIKRLKLNDSRTVDMRLHFVQNLLQGHVTIQYIREHAPFLASEMQRLGLDRNKLKQFFTV
jgi:hypothetical protein